jgi:hypothetical protein
MMQKDNTSIQEADSAIKKEPWKEVNNVAINSNVADRA